MITTSSPSAIASWQAGVHNWVTGYEENKDMAMGLLLGYATPPLWVAHVVRKSRVLFHLRRMRLLRTFFSWWSTLAVLYNLVHV